MPSFMGAPETRIGVPGWRSGSVSKYRRISLAPERRKYCLSPVPSSKRDMYTTTVPRMFPELGSNALAVSFAASSVAEGAHAAASELRRIKHVHTLVRVRGRLAAQAYDSRAGPKSSLI